MEAAGVGFVIVQVGIGRKLVTDPHHHILKDQGPVRKGTQLYPLSVLYAKPRRRFRCQVDVPFRNDHALPQLHRTHGAGKHRAGASGHMAGKPDRCRDAQAAAVGQGNFHLGLLPLRPQHRHIPEFSLGPPEGNPFPGKKLPRLAQGSFRCQAVAEQSLGLLPGHMDVAAGSLQLHKQPVQNRIRKCRRIHSISSFTPAAPESSGSAVLQAHCPEPGGCGALPSAPRPPAGC